MNNLIMSTEKTEICTNLKSMGFNIIPSETLENMLPFEKNHADMQCLKINNHFFVLNECKTLYQTLKNHKKKVTKTAKNIEDKYPHNILLNCAYIKNFLVCNQKHTDINVLKYCEENNIKILNVKQGYSKCSTAIIGDGFITADKGIYNALTDNGVEGILISSGNIRLTGVDYGFIGGCCFSDENNVYFSGNIVQHNNYCEIESFCYKQRKNVICLSKDNLYDIGGFVLL